jgi:hypothetical protein
VTSDVSGRIHLLQLIDEPLAPPLVRYQMWDGSRWQPGRNLVLAAETIQQILGLDAAVDADGNLVAAVADRAGLNQGGERPYRIVLGSIALPPSDRTAAPTMPATLTATPDEAASAEPTATLGPPLPTPAFSSDVASGAPGLAVAVAAALASTALLLGVALVQRFRRPPEELPPPNEPTPGSD